MTLPVPLTVRVGETHVTHEVQSLSFRREAIGGVRSISFTLARPLTELEGLDPLAKVHVFDGRNAQTVAEGRLSDTGRGTGGDGERWACVAFGPAQHASDITAPLIYVDRDLGAWVPAGRTNPSLDFGSNTKPDGTAGGMAGLVATIDKDAPITNNDFADMRYSRIASAGMKLGGFSFSYDQGITAADIFIGSVISSGGSHAPGNYEGGPSYTWSTAGGTGGADVVTHFANGRDTIDLRNLYTGPTGTVSAAGWWSWAGSIVVRGLVHSKTGAEITSGYIFNTFIYAHDVVADLLGRGLLPEFDAAGATLATNSTTQITQLAYENGVTPEQVLTDLMAFEPAYRWTTTPDSSGNGYGFRWEQWPTTVRYEATLDDGGNFPLSTQALYNRVWVQYRDEYGVIRNILRTSACAALDDAGLVRQAFIELGGEAGSLTQAIGAGDAFLADHNVPKNSGTLTVARPIRDLIFGAQVEPWEIEAGELVRIRGVEAYPDAFNADTNDGQGVFRIFSVDYTTEGNQATLALDSDPRETEDALVKLLNQRNRR